MVEWLNIVSLDTRIYVHGSLQLPFATSGISRKENVCVALLFQISRHLLLDGQQQTSPEAFHFTMFNAHQLGGALPHALIKIN